jgi:hypothetical protein
MEKSKNNTGKEENSKSTNSSISKNDKNIKPISRVQTVKEKLKNQLNRSVDFVRGGKNQVGKDKPLKPTNSQQTR